MEIDSWHCFPRRENEVSHHTIIETIIPDPLILCMNNLKRLYSIDQKHSEYDEK